MSNTTSREDALRADGIDPSNYLAFGGIADGVSVDSETDAQVQGSDESVESCDVESDEAFFGKKSQFYGKMMRDGNIYNPYIHRRWIAAMFLLIIKAAGCNHVYDYVRTHYNWKYVIRFLREEAAKLAKLERQKKREPKAFAERSRFFSLRAIRLILIDYMNLVFMGLDDGQRKLREISCDRKNSINIVGFGEVKLEHIRPIKHRYDVFYKRVEGCTDYAQLSRVLEAFDFAVLPSDVAISDSFIHPFVEAGAFYTLKNKIMFDGLSLGGEDDAENLRALNERGAKGFMTLFAELSAGSDPLAQPN